jgi:hypothetical protein
MGQQEGGHERDDASQLDELHEFDGTEPLKKRIAAPA